MTLPAITFRGKEITPPEGIRSDQFVIRPVLASDVELDYAVSSTGSADWSDIEATVFFWVSELLLAEKFDRTVLDTIRPWFRQDWNLGPHVIVTREPFEQQVAMIEAADLELQFRIQLVDDPASHRAYA